MNTKQKNDPWMDITRMGQSWLHILRTALTSFNETYAAQAAAALAYYAIFSLFPLLLFFIIVGSYFLDSQRVFAQVTWSLEQILPLSQQVIDVNLRHVLEARGAIGIVVLITLLWSASGAFTSLAYNIDLAWPMARRRNFFQKRMIGFRMIAGITVLLILSIVLDWVAHLAPLVAFFNASLTGLGLLMFFSAFVSWLTVFVMLLVLYRWIPAASVRWDAAFWGALFASIAWKIASAAFGWYLQSGFGRYQLVYGSLGAMIALLFLIYLISFIILFGAHLTAAMDISEKQKLGIPNV